MTLSGKGRPPLGRCRFSKEGLAWLSPRKEHVEREGDLISDGPKYRYVRWDGNESATGYARRFIEVLPAKNTLDDPLGRCEPR